jgi:hypothetical protein
MEDYFRRFLEVKKSLPWLVALWVPLLIAVCKSNFNSRTNDFFAMVGILGLSILSGCIADLLAEGIYLLARIFTMPKK